MYGFLRADLCYLDKRIRSEYMAAYCGQCAALHKIFGYPWRALVSYDAAFAGLLLSAQMDEISSVKRSWCGIFPKRIDIYDPSQLPQAFSATIAALLFSTRVLDSQQERGTVLTKIRASLCKKTLMKALAALGSIGFPVTILEETMRLQSEIEKKKMQHVLGYALPTEKFTGEVLRFTAKAAGLAHNEEVLYEIGLHVGRIIYLADSCIDLLDDIEKDEFNALYASYKDNITTISGRASGEIVNIVINSLNEIKVLLQQVELKSHGDLIQHILLKGFPLALLRSINRSINELKRNKSELLPYLPHAALVTALCLGSPQDAHALGWVWGDAIYCNSKERADCLAYGCLCCEDSKECAICSLIELVLNPCVCMTSEKYGPGPCTCCFEVPKMIFDGAMGVIALNKGAEISAKQAQEYEKRAAQERKQEDIRRREELERKTKEIEKEKARKRKEIEDREERNRIYMQDSLKELNSIISYFSYAPLGTQVIPENYQEDIESYIDAHKSEELTSDQVLNDLIKARTSVMRVIKARFDEVMTVHTQVRDKLYKINRRIGSYPLHLVHEIVFLEHELTSLNMKYLLDDWRWDDCKAVLQSLMVDMERLQMLICKD